MFAAKCAGYLKHAVSVVIIDVVTERTANLHADWLEALEVSQGAWDHRLTLCRCLSARSGSEPIENRGIAGGADPRAILAANAALVRRRVVCPFGA